MNRTSPSQGSHTIYSYTQWREHFLDVVLRGTCVIGLISVVLYIFTPANLAMKALAVLMYGTLIVITFAKWIPNYVKSSVFLIFLYVAGLSSLFDYGVAAAAVFFLGFVIMTGLLVSARNAIYYAVIFTFLNLVIFGWQNTSFIEWARSVGMTMLVATMVAIGLRTSLDEFMKTQEAARHMLNTLEGERSTLEERVEQRTAGLAVKTEHLRATSYIASKIAEIQGLEPLLNAVAQLITDQFGFYHTGIFLINEAGDRAVLLAASSEGGQRMMEAGHSLSVGTQGIVGYVAAQKKPRIAVDVGADATFFNNSYLPMTRSEVALPLMARNKVLGVLDIQSDKPLAFGFEDLDVLQTLADQIAIAIENARLMDETQAAIMQLEALSSLRTREAWSNKLREKDRVFTYTPLGLRAEKISHGESEAISAPIMLRGQKIGNISIARKGDATWSKLDKELIEEVASQVGLAVDNIRLLEEATQRARQEQAVGKLAARFSQSLDIDTLLQTAARELGQLPNVSEVSVFVGQHSEPTSQSKQRVTRTTS